MTFNFKSYLERLDPAYTYHVDQLTGGVINFTVRASKVALTDSAAAARETPTAGSDSNLQIGTFPGHKSLILKHATSHIAEIGEGSHIPQTRQASLNSSLPRVEKKLTLASLLKQQPWHSFWENHGISRDLYMGSWTGRAS